MCDAILHEHVGDRHAGGRQHKEEKARKGHARRLRRKKMDMLNSSECLLVKGYVITGRGRGERAPGDSADVDFDARQKPLTAKGAKGGAKDAEKS